MLKTGDDLHQRRREVTNYTIEMLKKEESRLADCIDILNAMGVEESTPEKLGLTTARGSVRKTLEILESRLLGATDMVNMKSFRWKKSRGNIAKAVENLDESHSAKEYASNATCASNDDEKSKRKKRESIENPCDKTVEFALSLLDKINREGRTATRLRLVNNGHATIVEDFSIFCHVDYMSEDLMDALKNGRTLTKNQKIELDPFIIEVTVEI